MLTKALLGTIPHEFASRVFTGVETEVETDGVTVEGTAIDEEVELLCDLPGHLQQGMWGVIAIQ